MGYHHLALACKDIQAIHDFYEGVRAVIIDKDNMPQWKPTALADISNEDVQAHFADLGDKELAFL